MDLTSIIIAMISMGGLGIIFSMGLSIANKKLYVEEDPRIAEVIEELPGVNCGGCGLPGCAKFAESIVKGEVTTTAGIPESFNVLVQELRGLALDISIFDSKNKQIALTERDEELINRQGSRF